MDKQAFFERLKLTESNAPASTELPDWNAASVKTTQQPKGDESNWEVFKDRFTTVNGLALDTVKELEDFIKKNELNAGYLDEGITELKSFEASMESVQFSNEFKEELLDDYQFSITKAAGVIAETGTVILKEATTSSRLAALAPWIHIAVLTEDSKVYPTLLEAIEDFGNDPYIVFATGPSKTADVEGILIEGVHGPGIQVCCKIND